MRITLFQSRLDETCELDSVPLTEAYKTLLNTNIAAETIYQFPGTFGECWLECDNYVGCVAFSHDNATGTCYLKALREPLVSDATTITYTSGIISCKLGKGLLECRVPI